MRIQIDIDARAKVQGRDGGAITGVPDLGRYLDVYRTSLVYNIFLNLIGEKKSEDLSQNLKDTIEVLRNSLVRVMNNNKNWYVMFQEALKAKIIGQERTYLTKAITYLWLYVYVLKNTEQVLGEVPENNVLKNAALIYRRMIGNMGFLDVNPQEKVFQEKGISVDEYNIVIAKAIYDWLQKSKKY